MSLNRYIRVALSAGAVASLVMVAGSAMASGYAVLGPGFATGRPDARLAGEVIARARAALGRPPGAIARLHTEGTLPGKGIREESLVAKRDQPIVLDLAMAWRLTHDRAFLDQAGRYLDAWASVYQLSFNPIDETGFDQLMMAYDLTEADLRHDVRDRVDALWRRMAAGYLDAMDAGPKNAATNWQSHRVKLAAMAAFQTGDPALIARAGAAFRKQVAANLRPDGSTFDFEERDALHYVTYDLEPLAMAALAARAHGQDWYGWAAPGGASLPRSLDWLLPYADGSKTHIEFVNSKVQFDRDRAAAGQEEYAPHAWKAANALNLYRIAGLLDARFKATASGIEGREGGRPEAWIALYGRLSDR